MYPSRYLCKRPVIASYMGLDGQIVSTHWIDSLLLKEYMHKINARFRELGWCLKVVVRQVVFLSMTFEGVDWSSLLTSHPASFLPWGREVRSPPHYSQWFVVLTILHSLSPPPQFIYKLLWFMWVHSALFLRFVSAYLFLTGHCTACCCHGKYKFFYTCCPGTCL